ncbi:MAG TPA: hypothetical protein VF784_12955, partial [Anaerolineales bacterium]
AGMSRQSISRFEKKLAASGITSFSLDQNKVLPPLLPILQTMRNAGHALANSSVSQAPEAADSTDEYNGADRPSTTNEAGSTEESIE